MRGTAGRVVFVGNLPGDVRKREVEDLFCKYGRILSIDLKLPPRPPAFGFIEFDHLSDAQDAVYALDGCNLFGFRLRVEIAHNYDDRIRTNMPAPTPYRGRCTPHRIIVKGLPMTASWQDLKDFFRRVVRPAFTNIVRGRGAVIGIVEFHTQEDLKQAQRKLDDTEFANPFDRCFVRLFHESDGTSSRSSSPPRARVLIRSPRSRSPSRSPVWRSHGSSRSPSGSRSKSNGRRRRGSPSSRSTLSRTASRGRSAGSMEKG